MSKFYYFSNSADKKPGSGVNEILFPGDDFTELSKIKDWRKVLSNFYEFPIIVDQCKFATVEHYYQGSKFQKESPSFFKLFTISSGSEFSQDPAAAKSAGGKGGGKYRPKHIKADSDFFTKNHDECMYKALYAKFSIPGLPRDVLLATKNAELWHGTRGVPPSRQYLLEKVRRNISSTNNKISIDEFCDILGLARVSDKINKILN